MTTAQEIGRRAAKRAGGRRAVRGDSRRRAEEAIALRIEQRLGWREIATRVGYVSEQAALHAARRAGYTANEAVGTCRTCGVEVPRTGIRGRTPEFCPNHRRERLAELAQLRQAAVSAALPARHCLDCGVKLERAPGRLRQRCVECGRRRRRERERARDRRRAAAKLAKARAVGYTTVHWKRVSRAAIARAGECADCGRTDDLTGHLANPELEGDHRKATIDDVEVLCRSCHGRLTAAA